MESIWLLEKSSVSRLVQMLKKKSLVKEVASKKDARIKFIELTGAGKRELKNIDAYAEARLSTSLNHLSEVDCKTVMSGLTLYCESLTKGRQQAS